MQTLFLVGYSCHEVICLRFWLLWRDNFAKHLLINRSHKPDMPTKVSYLLLPLRASFLISWRALLVGAILLIGSPQSKYSRSKYFILRQTHNFQDSNNLRNISQKICELFWSLDASYLKNIQGQNNLWNISWLFHKLFWSLDMSYLKNIQGPNNLQNISQQFCKLFWSLETFYCARHQ